MTVHDTGLLIQFNVCLLTNKDVPSKLSLTMVLTMLASCSTIYKAGALLSADW